MHPAIHAKTNPRKAAIIVAETGEKITYGMLDGRSNRVAHLFRAKGLRPGDVVAIFMENSPTFFDVTWGAQRSGLLFTCVSSKASASELAYILEDSGAKLLIASDRLKSTATDAIKSLPEVQVYFADAPVGGEQSLADAVGALPETPIANESAGSDMLYSSGTTGRPKGVKPVHIPDLPIDAPHRVTQLAESRFHFAKDSVYLSPAPLYHAAPLRWSMAVHRLGGTVVLMRRFDPLAALGAIEQYKIDVSQWVPTHFVRLLKLHDDQRTQFDLSSLRIAVHAAAPCPAEVKRQMMQWWGPILHEYYGGTEGIGMTAISPEEWVRKQGSVGHAISGEIRICGDDGKRLPTGSVGLVYFANGPRFEYHNDPIKTQQSYNDEGWATFGDVGYVDDEDYLYLTDRKSFMIISGGVNIYPQEIENYLVTHPKVADVAVVGGPDVEMGERVIAAIQPVNMSDAGPGLAAELTEFVRSHLSHVKTPRQIDFYATLPRMENGKLYKREIRDRYWKEAQTAA
jgi:acyl-CoA synthetase (AMP-forming)/AMP-acid ligase II